MSGLALAAQAAGASVTGSDKEAGRYLSRLRQRGIEVELGHAADTVPDGAEVVYSSAVPPENPERREPELRRGELLGQLTRLRRCIAVAGSHGKTTTAAMIVHALRGAGQRPGYVIGSDLLATGLNAEWGDSDGEWLVVETDESDRTFLEVRPEIAVVTDVGLEHVQTYPTRRDVDEAFAEFLAQAEQAVAWDPPSPRLEPGRSRFRWRDLEVEVGMPGEHNARNAAAALEACLLAGAEPVECAAALADYPGTARRFEHAGTTPAGAEVYDDYAGHPTEILATLHAARTLEPERLFAVLQPWGPLRVKRMAGEYRAALAPADRTLVLELYSPRAVPPQLAGITAGVIAAGVESAEFVAEAAEAERRLQDELGAGDLCVVLCPGDALLARRLVTAGA